MRLTSRSITVFSSLITILGGTTAFAKPKPGVHPNYASNCFGYQFTICGMGDNCGVTDLDAECQALLGCTPVVSARCDYIDMGGGFCDWSINMAYYEEFKNSWSDSLTGSDPDETPPFLVCDF